MREVHAGSGYWSVDAPTTVLALPDGADSLIVHWPGGTEKALAIRAGEKEIVITK
jgi:hypothetical protein